MEIQKRKNERTSEVAECLKEVICCNQHLKQETKTSIYKAAIRPIMTYKQKHNQMHPKPKNF